VTQERWSKWKPLTDDSLEKAPRKRGVYELKANFYIHRLLGKSPILYVGSAPKEGTTGADGVYGRLGCFEQIYDEEKDEVWHHHARRDVRTLLQRKRLSPDKIQFRYKLCSNPEEEEERLLQEYKHKYLELPPFNKRK